jgi:Fe2+ transport system protein FeoA
MGLYPGTPFRVAAMAPFRGPITIEVAGVPHVLGHEAAGRIVVGAASEK